MPRLFDDETLDDATCPKEPPSREAIMAECERIRGGWSPREERKRAGRREWTPPAVAVCKAE